MRPARLITCIFATVLTARALWAADPYPPKSATAPVSVLRVDWKDPARNTTVLVKIYFPKTISDSPAPLPLIIFSHGLGGSRDAYQFWGQYWASQGYIVIHPDHSASDEAQLAAAQNNPQAFPIPPAAAVHRIKDVSFVIDTMEKANAGTSGETYLAPFKNKVDLKNIGVAGHSFGAQTALMLAGQLEKLNGPDKGPVSLRDPRITAAITMSPQGAILVPQNAAFVPVQIPVLLLTGTADDNPGGLAKVKAADRRVVFDNLTAPNTFQAIFQSATHYTFAPNSDGTTPAVGLRSTANPNGDTPDREAHIHTLIRQATTAFWDAYLKHDDHARKWLHTDFATVLGSAGTFETKPPAKSGE